MKILHSARQDLEIFHQLGEQVPAPVFDTQIAASLLGLGEQISYANLVRHYTGIGLDKSQTRTDWAARPLSASQIDYAANDVRYLYDIWQAQCQELARRGQRDWLDEDFADLVNPALYRVDPEQAWRRVKGWRKLRPRQLLALQGLAAWRERRAMADDRPRKWVLPDEVLFDIARQMPQTRKALGRIRGFDERRHGNLADALLGLVGDAAAATKDQLPEPVAVTRIGEDDKAVADLLMAVLRQLCLDAGISPGFVAGRAEIEQLAAHGHSDTLLHGWRRRLVGERLLAVREGRAVVSVEQGRVTID